MDSEPSSQSSDTSLSDLLNTSSNLFFTFQSTGKKKNNIWSSCQIYFQFFHVSRVFWMPQSYLDRPLLEILVTRVRLGYNIRWDRTESSSKLLFLLSVYRCKLWFFVLCLAAQWLFFVRGLIVATVFCTDPLHDSKNVYQRITNFFCKISCTP